MRHLMTAVFGLSLVAVNMTRADEYTVELIHETAPADDLSAEIVAQLSPTGYRVVRNGSRTVWEIWPRKNWDVEDGFSPSQVRLYPFQPGELIGVARLPRRGADFRDQTLSRGVYTLRYALQPIDGNHVGTSPTRDFLLMLRAEDDAKLEPPSADQLLEASAEAAGSSHPAMICLQRLSDDAPAPSIRLLEEPQWWVLRFAGAAGDDGTSLPLDLIVVGHATE